MKKTIIISLVIALKLTAATKDTAFVNRILNIPDLVCLWDFSEPAGDDKVSIGPNAYSLKEGDGRIDIGREDEGPLSGYSADFGSSGSYFYIERDSCPELNISGPDAKVTVVTWIKRKTKNKGDGWNRDSDIQAVAGMWNEYDSLRQYCLFLDLRIWDSFGQVCGHVSNIGGPSPHYEWCMDASIGETVVPVNEWTTIGFTYDADSALAKSYLNGVLDVRMDYIGAAYILDEWVEEEWISRNPYYYPGGLFDGRDDGADFTVGGVYRSGRMGNYFAGLMGGLAVFSRALTDSEMVLIDSSENVLVSSRPVPSRQVSAQQDLHAAYNPFLNTLTVSVPGKQNVNADITIYTIIGQVLYNSRMSESSHTIPLNTSAAPQVLLVRINGRDINLQKKILCGLPR